MTKALVVVDFVGPSSALFFTAVGEIFEEVFVYCANDNGFMGPNSPFVPPWASDPSTYEFKLWLGDFFETEDVRSVFSFGFESTNLAAGWDSSLPLFAALLPGEVDISRRRKRRLAQFRRFSGAVECLIFFNEWEMYKAASLGSQARHFLWDLSAESVSSQWSLTSDPFGETVVFYDHKRRGTISSLEELGFVSDLNGLSADRIRLQPSNSLYWHGDLLLGRALIDTAALRTGNISKAVFVDHDSDSLSVLSSIKDGNVDTVWATHSVETSLLQINSNNRFSIGSLVKVARALNDDMSDFPAETAMTRVSKVGRTLSEILMYLEDNDLPWFFEDFGDTRVLNLFFSVAPLENRSNGARPQRIRNMFLAMSRDLPTMQLSFNEFVLARRELLIYWLIDKGFNIPFLYGENSTNPIFDLEGPLRLSRLVDNLAHLCSTKSLYFVRDVHWLDKDLQGKLDESTLKYGKQELERVSMSFGGLVAPSAESARYYSELASDRIPLQFMDAELPPAIGSHNATPASMADEDSDKTTFVYTGGVSNLYSMDKYLNALSKLFGSYGGSFLVDFVVRKEEKDTLVEWLSKHEIKDEPSVRIITEDFDQYFSRSARCIGILLLDSEYGKNAFAFKAVSYLERRIPFVVYSSSPNYRYFKDYGVAIPVDAAADDGVLCGLIDGLNFKDSDVDWPGLERSESWDSRWQQVQHLASTRFRELR